MEYLLLLFLVIVIFISIWYWNLPVSNNKNHIVNNVENYVPKLQSRDDNIESDI